MISKTTQPTLINYPSNNSPHDVKLTKRGDSEIPFRSRVMGFSNNCLVFFSWKRGFSMGNSCTEEPLTLHHKQMISGEELHTLITFMVSVMASNIVDGL